MSYQIGFRSPTLTLAMIWGAPMVVSFPSVTELNDHRLKYMWKYVNKVNKKGNNYVPKNVQNDLFIMVSWDGIR